MRAIPCYCLLLLGACVSPGKEMQQGHPEFWQDVVGRWEIPQSRAALVFGEDMHFEDPGSIICPPGERPAHWSGATPADTVFTVKQQDWTRSGKGSATLQKVRYLRGQFLAVCHGERFAYRDYIVFYGRTAAEAGLQSKPGAAAAKVMVVQGEDGQARTYTYRR